jgi:PDZ domain-containing protein
MTEADLTTASPRPPDVAPPGPPPRRGWRSVVAVGSSVLAVIFVVVLVAGFLIHLPYVVISPGDATPVDSSVVKVDGAPTYPNTNAVRFLTVRVTDAEPNVWRVVQGWLDPNMDVQDRGSVVGCLTADESVTYNEMLMKQSQDDAANVALTRLGYQVVAEPPRVTVVQACPGTPAHGELAVGDQLVTIDDQPVTDSAGLVSLIRAHPPGTSLRIGVQRDGAARTADVVTGRLSGSSCKPVAPGAAVTGTACIGTATQQFMTYQFPVRVTIDAQDVIGPSAGLAFTLAIIDEMTPGDLLGPTRVAVTGAIAPDGTVQPVGGVEQKIITARHNSVQLVLVPRSEAASARKRAQGMKVVGVDTVDDALAALQRAGGAPLPPASTVAARS